MIIIICKHRLIFIKLRIKFLKNDWNSDFSFISHDLFYTLLSFSTIYFLQYLCNLVIILLIIYYNLTHNNQIYNHISSYLLLLLICITILISFGYNKICFIKLFFSNDSTLLYRTYHTTDLKADKFLNVMKNKQLYTFIYDDHKLQYALFKKSSWDSWFKIFRF